MPIYEYECPNCKARKTKQFKVEHRDAVYISCDECDTSCGMRRVPSVPSPPKFKGSGFYETDYKAK